MFLIYEGHMINNIEEWIIKSNPELSMYTKKDKEGSYLTPNTKVKLDECKFYLKLNSKNYKKI